MSYTTINKPNNRGRIKGTILEKVEPQYQVEDEVFYEGKMVVDRLSGSKDTIPFTISEKIIKAYNLKLDKGEKICFIGELRSYNKMEEGHSRLVLSFFVKEVVKSEEEESINELSLTGYICKEPVYRTTPFNRQICDVLLAVNRNNYNRSDYIPCILWGRNAKLVQSQRVGTKLIVYGRIQSRIYRKDLGDGQIEERTAYEVSIQKIEIVENEELSSQGLA